LPNTTNGHEEIAIGAKTVKGRLDYDRTSLEAREKLLRELQEKFERLAANITDGLDAKEDIPEIREGVDGKLQRESRRPGQFLRQRFVLVAFAAAIGAGALLKINYLVQGHGEAAPIDTVIIKSPVDGVLREISFDEGNSVERGQVVCKFDSSATEVQLAKSREELVILSTQLKFTESNLATIQGILEKKRNLVEKEALPLSDLESAQMLYDNARIRQEGLRAEAKQLEAKVESLKGELDQERITSPINGTVVTHNVKRLRGQFFEKGDKICEIADTSGFMVEVSIPEKRVKEISVGQPARVRFKDSSTWYDGKVLKVAEFSGRPQLLLKELLMEKEIYRKGVVVQVLLQTTPVGLKYGMEADVKIITGKKTVLGWLCRRLAGVL